MDASLTVPAFGREGSDAGRAGRSGPRASTVVVVAGLHIAVIGALGLLFEARRMPSVPAEASLPVVFVPAPTPQPTPAPQTLASSDVSPSTQEELATLAPIQPMALPPSEHGFVAPRRAIRRDTDRLARLQDLPVAATKTEAPPMPVKASSPVEHPATPATTPSNGALQALANWEARIRQAVQDAALYPTSARLLHREGRAQVRFDYERGAVEQASVAESSHVGALDTAAVAAVTRAAIPGPPAEIGPQRRTMLVWVQFRLSQEE